MPVVGLGMDICSIDRIQRILDGPRAEKFLERVYTEAERARCVSRQEAAAACAARFAAKEALLKALGAPSGIRWREIEVVATSGAPELRLTGVAEAELRRRNAFALLSISHDAGVAAAAVILEAGWWKRRCSRRPVGGPEEGAAPGGGRLAQLRGGQGRAAAGGDTCV